jgi:hypothetical protein
LTNQADNFPQEQIPDDANLFMRIHRDWLLDNGDVKPGFFRNIPADDGMSCDWDKYSTAAQTKERAKNPEVNGVLQFGARDARGLPDQRLAHDPQEDNRAHSQLFGEKTTEIRLKLKRLCKWAILISQPV